MAFCSSAPQGKRTWNFPDLMFCEKISAHSVGGGSASESEGSESELVEPDSESTPVGASAGGSSGCGASVSVGNGFEVRFAHSSESSRPSTLEEWVKGHLNSGDRRAHHGRVTGGILCSP